MIIYYVYMNFHMQIQHLFEHIYKILFFLMVHNTILDIHILTI